MQRNSNIVSGQQSQITLDIPVHDASLFRSQAVNELLTFLSRHHTDEFSITELATAINYSQPSVSKAVTVLTGNDLAVDRRDGNTRLVQINRDRLSKPDDPLTEIPQGEFQEPVRTAVDTLNENIETILAIVLYGSVARGEADRRSDIDLWVLVEADRLKNQRAANRIRQRLEEQTFENDRYEYEIDVEGVTAVPNYIEELREILSEGLVLYDTEKFATVKSMILHGDLDE